MYDENTVNDITGEGELVPPAPAPVQMSAPERLAAERVRVLSEAVARGDITEASFQAPSPLNLTVEEVQRLYAAMQSQGVPLVDNTMGQPLIDFVPKKRVVAHSFHGDNVWQVCQYIIDWMIACGDEEVVAKALTTRAYWAAEQKWMIDWCNNHLYFHWCELAMKNVKEYKKALAMFPSEAGSVEESVRRLALMFAEDYHKPVGIKIRPVRPLRHKCRRR